MSEVNKTPVEEHDDNEAIAEPENQKALRKQKNRNMLILLLVCAIVGGGGFIYVSRPAPVEKQQELSDLERRLSQAAGAKKHPSLAGRRNYNQDFAQKVTGEVQGIESQVGQFQNDVQTINDTILQVQTNFGQFLEQYQADMEQRQRRDEDLRITLDAQAQAVAGVQQQLDASQNERSVLGGFPANQTPKVKKKGTDIPDDSGSQPGGTPGGSRQDQLRTIERYEFKLSPRKSTRQIKTRTTDNYLPAGSYAEGRIIMGAKTSAAVDAQSDPRPILIRVNSVARGPRMNGDHTETDITGCTITASAYGDVSSEQGHAKLQQMTCPVGPDEVKTTKVYGYIGYRGMYGVHSKVIMREGDLAERALWAGMLASSGDAATTAIGTTSSSALGNVKTVDGLKDAAGTVLAGGLEQTGDTLSRYYIKRLEQIQPVIPLRAGTDVQIVFMKGVSLDGTEDEQSATQTTRIPLDDPNSDVNPTNVNQQILQAIQHNQLRQEPTKTNWNNELYSN